MLADSGHVFDQLVHDQLVQLAFELLELILFGLQFLLGFRFRRLTLLHQLCGRVGVRLRAVEPLLSIPQLFRVRAYSSFKEVKEATLAASVF